MNEALDEPFNRALDASDAGGGKSRKRGDSTAAILDSVANPVANPEDGGRKKEKKKRLDLFAIPAETPPA